MEDSYLTLKNEKLKAVLAVYDSVVNYHHVNNNVLGAAQPLTIETSKEVFNFLNNIEIIATKYSFKELIIQKNVLYYSEQNKEVIWWTEAMEQELYFNSNLNLKSGKYPVPYLIWKLKGSSLSLWALSQAPTKSNQPLYNAPFLNINSQGDVCMGNVRFETKSNYYEEIILKTQTAFFNSFFTHTNHNNIVNGNYSDILNEMQGLKEFSNAKFTFPTNLLVKTNLKIKDLFKNGK